MRGTKPSVAGKSLKDLGSNPRVPVNSVGYHVPVTPTVHKVSKVVKKGGNPFSSQPVL